MKDYKQIESLTLEECESYLKDPNLSQTERQYVEQHREEMMKWPWKKSIMEEFPEYGFKPTSLLVKRAGNPSKVFYLAMGYTFLILTLISTVFCIIMSFLEGDGMPWWGIILFTIALNGPCVFLIIKGYSFKNKPFLDFKQEADYLATNRKLLANSLRDTKQFFVKNRKFGLITTSSRLKDAMSSKILIPAEYDKLSWKEKNRILVAEKNGETFLIDIFGNRLS